MGLQPDWKTLEILDELIYCSENFFFDDEKEVNYFGAGDIYLTYECQLVLTHPTESTIIRIIFYVDTKTGKLVSGDYTTR